MSEQEVFDYIYSVITREYLENRIQKLLFISIYTSIDG